MKTLVATPDGEWCPECLKKGRYEPINVTIRHTGTKCTRIVWCFVCGHGDGQDITCEDCDTLGSGYDR